MNPELAVIVNSFNRLILLKECLPNIIDILNKIRCANVIVVFDAGSTDGSIDYVRQLSNQNPSIILISAADERNVSFSAGCNKAVKEAMQYSTIQHLLFFETDNLFNSELPLRQAIELVDEKKELASVGFTVEKKSGQKIVFGNTKPSVWGFILGQQIASRLGIEQVNPTWLKSKTGIEYSPTDIVFTSPLLVRASVWSEVGGMDEINFPFSDSDTDLCLRFLSRQHRNAVIRCSGVVHDNLNNISSWSAQRVYNYHHARYRLLTKHKPWSRWILNTLLPLRHFMELMSGKILGKSSDYISNRKRLLFSVWNGYS